MPIQRTPEHFPSQRDFYEGLDMRAQQMLYYLEQVCEPGMLYTEQEILDILRDKTEMPKWLKMNRYPALSLISTYRSTSVRPMLHNLWRNRLVGKFATGTFRLSAKPTGIVWRIIDERQDISPVRRVQEQV